MKPVGNSPSAEVKAAVKERDGFRCVFCGSPRHLTIDHIVPKALGGRNNIENLQTLCGRCNGDKGASMPAGLRRSQLDPRVARLLA